MLLKKEKLPELLKELKKLYPKTKTALVYNNSAYQLLVAVILSAQCTDERVNKVTPVLFKKYPTPEKMANADIKDIEAIDEAINEQIQKKSSIETEKPVKLNETKEDILAKIALKEASEKDLIEFNKNYEKSIKKWKEFQC